MPETFSIESKELKVRNLWIVSSLALLVLGPLASVLLAQTQERSQRGSPQARDLSGVWLVQGARGSFSDEPPPPMTSWAKAKFRGNRPTMGPRAALDANDPTLDCFPPGVPYVLMIPTPVEIIQVPGRVIELFEYNHSVRQVYTDGRKHPGDLQDTGAYQWMGHSIGNWEGDTFLIDTIGFNDKTWLDRVGHPHSDSLHVVERLRRVDHDTLEDNLTIIDPAAYAKPWAGHLLFKLKSTWDILEHTCLTRENEGRAYLEYHNRTWAPSK